MDSSRPLLLSSRSLLSQSNPGEGVFQSGISPPSTLDTTTLQGRSSMDRFQHRGHQSLDHGRSWRQHARESQIQQIPREVPGRERGALRPNWYGTQAAGDSKSWQWQPSATNYTTLAPTPSQIELLNSFGSNFSGKYAYFMDRGHGRVTRLIPADVLPPLNEIPALEMKGYGMEILPALRSPPPSGVAEMNQRVTVQESRLRPGPEAPNCQNSTDPPTGPTTPKKNKIYCDKWVHEGTCAFTQQGCRFKHEMPYDKATQNSLGLFHGLPAWWKKRQADLQRHREIVAADRERGVVEEPQTMSPVSKSPLAGSVPDTSVVQQRWRETDMPIIRRNDNRPMSTNGPVSPCIYPFGPIEPPRKSTQ